MATPKTTTRDKATSPGPGRPRGTAGNKGGATGTPATPTNLGIPAGTSGLTGQGGGGTGSGQFLLNWEQINLHYRELVECNAQINWALTTMGEYAGKTQNVGGSAMAHPQFTAALLTFQTQTARFIELSRLIGVNTSERQLVAA